MSIPTKVYYGRKIWELSLRKIAADTELFDKNILIVTTGRSLTKLGYVESLRKEIQCESGANIVRVYDEISANPRLSEVRKGIEIAKELSAGLVVGFGGGSAIDAAKAIAAGTVSDTSIDEIFCKGIEPLQSVPVIAIPTTAGTGSELSKAAILTDEIHQKKGGLRGEKLFPVAAIVDSYFTESVPLKTTMETGFDVLAHAIESYISKAATPYSEMLSEYVIENAGRAIKTLAKDLNNIDARATMSFCSMIMGINLANVGTALPHRMQYPIGAHTQSSHGAGLAALYPSWIRYESKYSTKKIERIFELLDIDDINELLKIIGLEKTILELGLKNPDERILSSEVAGNLKNDPAFDEPEILIKIYSESF